MVKKKSNIKIQNTPDIINNPSMKLFFMLCIYLLSVLVLYTLFQFIRFENCLGITQILSILTPLLIYVYYLNKDNLKQNIIIISTYLILLLIVPFLFGKIPDLSYDGNAYHKTAIAYIKNGWNPLYETSKEFSNTNKNIIEIHEESDVDIWIEHYPKGTWIVGATLYEMTGNIESGKALTIYLLVMLLIISFNCLRTILDKKWSGLISLLICANPVIIYQIFTYYIDGIMGILFIIELLLLFLINPIKKQNIYTWLSLGSICILYTNIKFTGLLCSGLIAAIFYFYWFFKYKKAKEFWKHLKNITFNFIIIFLTAILFVGANSYIKNTFEHNHPLYPLFGEGKYDIITAQQPKSFKNKSSIEKFLISTFSKTDNIMRFMDKEPQLKNPLKIYESELKILDITDIRIAGFGPLYALILSLSIPIFLISLIIFIKYEKKKIKYITIPLIAIILSMILVGEYWWARYVPQFYLFPLGTLILTIYITKYYKKEIIPKLMSIILSLVIIINICLFIPSITKQLRTFLQVERDFYIISEMNNPKIKIISPDLSGQFYNLKDRNIDYIKKEKINEKNAHYYYNGNLIIEQDN